MGGFQEVLSKSLKELHALIAAEHESQVHDLERRLLLMQCKAEALAQHNNRANAAGEADDDLPPENYPRGPSTASCRGSIEHDPSGHGLAPPGRKMFVSSCRHSIDSADSEGLDVRNVQSDGQNDKGGKKKSVGHGGVRQFIRKAMRQKSHAKIRRASRGTAGHLNRASTMDLRNVSPDAKQTTRSQRPSLSADAKHTGRSSLSARASQRPSLTSALPSARGSLDMKGETSLTDDDYQLGLSNSAVDFANVQPDVGGWQCDGLHDVPDGMPEEKKQLCDNCGNAFLRDAKFCRKCGKRRPVDQVCICGNIFAPDALFCRQCGRPRGSDDSPDSGRENPAASRSEVDGDRTEDAKDKMRQRRELRHGKSMEDQKNRRISEEQKQGDSEKQGHLARQRTMSTKGNNLEQKDGELEKFSNLVRQRTSTLSTKGNLHQKSNIGQQDEKSVYRAPRPNQDRESTASMEGSDVKTRAEARRRGKAALTRSRTDSVSNYGILSRSRTNSIKEKSIKENEAPIEEHSSDSGFSSNTESGQKQHRHNEPSSVHPSSDSGSASISPEQDVATDQPLAEAVHREHNSQKSVHHVHFPSQSLDAESSLQFVERMSDPNVDDGSGLLVEVEVPVVEAPENAPHSQAEADMHESIHITPPSALKPQPPQNNAPMLNVPLTANGSLLHQAGDYEQYITPSPFASTRNSYAMTPNHLSRRPSVLDFPTVSRAGSVRSVSRMSIMGQIGQLQERASFLSVGGGPEDVLMDGSEEDAGFELLDVWHMQDFRKTQARRLKNNTLPGDTFEEEVDYESSMYMDEFQTKSTTDPNKAAKSEKSRCQAYIKRMILQPSSMKHLCWEMVGLLLICWDVILIPLDVYEPDYPEVIKYMTWFLRIFWLVDIIVSFMTGYLQDQGTLEMRPRKIAKRYLKTWFLPDVMCVGMDWAAVFLKDLKGSRALRIVRIVRLFRLLKAPEIDAFISEHIHSDNVILMGNIIKSITLLVGVAHILACLWYSVGKEASDPGAEGWVVYHGLTHSVVQDRYLWSLQWALGQFTGENVYEPGNMSMTERTYAVVVLLLTFLLSSMFVSSITTSVTQLQLTKSSSATQLTALRRYLVDADISTSLAARVLRNAQHLVNEQKRNMPEHRIELLKVVSEPLRAEVHSEVYGRVLREHKFFDLYNDINPQGMQKVCHIAIHRSHVSKGDIIFSDLETPAWPRMFFVLSGSLHYKQVDEKPELLHKHQFAAEAVLWTLWMHVGTLRAVGESDIIAVEAEKFQHIIRPFPTHHAQVYGNTLVECLNNVEEDSLTDLDMSLVDPYLKFIFPERYDLVTRESENRISQAIASQMPSFVPSPAASDSTSGFHALAKPVSKSGSSLNAVG